MLDVYVYVGCGPNTLIVLIGVRTTARLLLYPFLHDTAREGSLLRGLTSRLFFFFFLNQIIVLLG
jgi:hypothetical protein